MVNDERFVSKAGKSNYQVGLWGGGPGRRTHPTRSGTVAETPPCTLQLWHELCDLISQNPDKVQSLNVDAIIRGGLTRFTDQLGKLWCSLADYYIRSGHFEKVRGYTGYRALGARMWPRVSRNTCRCASVHTRAARAHVCLLKACWPAHRRGVSWAWVLHGCVAWVSAFEIL